MTKPSDSPTFMEIMDELRKFKGNDRSLVLIASGYIELLTEVLISEKCKNRKIIENDRRSYPFAAKLLLLNEVGVIEDSLYLWLDQFRKLRNRAAHDAIFSIGDSDRKNFHYLTGSTERELGPHCIILISRYWKAHSDIFNRRFCPKKGDV
jgi:hypothetical protein